ncbi:MAG: methyltransferase [Pseudomonadota bacterium]
MDGTDARLSLALSEGAVSVPLHGEIAVLAPRQGMALTSLPKDRCDLITGFFPDYDYFESVGWTCKTAPEKSYVAALVCLTRSKKLSQALVAKACEVTNGPVVIDGAKTDGVEAIMKACKKRTEVKNIFSKAHGKLFVIADPGGFEDWAFSQLSKIPEGFYTAPGIFSADGIDPASRLLADHLPQKLGKTIIDLGAGWGYLSHRALQRDDIEGVHLVEAEHEALVCARRNICDARAQFHWGDARLWSAESNFDTILMNPPFHTTRKAEPDLGRAFLAAAHRLLHSKGTLYMVANRHLPYETDLKSLFADVREFGGDNRFKLLQASRPSRTR